MSAAAGRPTADRDTLTFRPVNTRLQGVFDVLKHEAHSRPGVMGQARYMLSTISRGSVVYMV